MRTFLHSKLYIFICVILVAVILVPQLTLASDTKQQDKRPPTAPGNLTAAAVGQNSVSLTWSPSRDNKGIAAYFVYKDAVIFDAVTDAGCTVNGLTAGTAYSFFVEAQDTAGNLSASGNVLQVTTLALSTTPTPTAVPALTGAPILTPIVSSAPVLTSASTPVSTPTPTPTSATAATTKKVVGYYASWSAYSGYTPLNIPASKLTHINYAFANIGTDLKIAMGDTAVDPANFAKLNELKKSYPHLKTLISVGGWTWSGRFSDAALTDAGRTVFADSVVAFMKRYGFDGADLDWEYPVGGGLTSNASRPEDKTNFTLLLQKLREKFDAQGAIDGKQYLLTIAGGAGSFYAANTELRLIKNYVDYANVMTYDIHGAWDPYADFNAPLYNPTAASPQLVWSVDAAVKSWMTAGFPASKIVVGMPFYGYVYSNITGGTNGLYGRFTSCGSISYDKIVSDYFNKTAFEKFYHTDGLVPWLFDGSTFITYDDTQSIVQKADYILRNHLAGGSVWELSQNKDGTLLRALYDRLN